MCCIEILWSMNLDLNKTSSHTFPCNVLQHSFAVKQYFQALPRGFWLSYCMNY